MKNAPCLRASVTCRIRDLPTPSSTSRTPAVPVDLPAAAEGRAGQPALSDQITAFWKNFQNTGEPGGHGLPVWSRYRDGAQNWMEYLACDADSAGDRISGACSTADTSYVKDHQLALWASVAAP
jgi:hypothetical protein